MLAPLIVVAGLFWLALLVSGPFLPVVPAALTYVVSSLVCHQIPERSFHVGAVQLPVCARCLGIYSGFAMAALVALVTRSRVTGVQARIIALAGAVPTIATVAAEWAGLWRTSNVVRLMAGLPLGAALGLVVIGVLATLHYGQCARRPPITPHRPPSPI
jgi:uncharacterized membrane protein